VINGPVAVRIDPRTDYVVVRTGLTRLPSRAVMDRLGTAIKSVDADAVIDVRGRGGRKLVFLR
jgi:hypothetical protein